MARILIIGASSDIGIEVVNQGLGRGWQVIGTARDLRKAPTEAQEMLQLDLSEQGQLDDFGRYLSSLDYLDSLIFVAGQNRVRLLARETPEDFNSILNVNLVSQIFIVQAALRALLAAKSGASVVFVGSTAAARGHPGRISYSTSKAALVAAARVLSAEYGRRNIRFNVVVPGPISTKMLKTQLSQEEVEALANQADLRRLATCAEVAHVILFLASRESSAVTAQEIVVDAGGRS